ncbi:MAG: ATP-binding protein [bacterium]|nr:ATP-binding protein [bacterium]
MALTNTQYDTIFRDYEKVQLQNRHLLEEHRDEVYELIPEYKDIDSTIARLAMEQGKRYVSGDAEALSEMRKELTKLTGRKKLLLNEYGFPLDYLSPIYNCPDCKDTGYVNGKKCHCFQQAIIRLLYTQSNMEGVLSEENFDNFTYEYYNQTEAALMGRIVNECKAFINTFDQDYRNLFFYGNVGVGKTFLTNCIAKELLESGHSVIYFTAFQLFDALAKKTFRSYDVSEEINNVYEHIFNCDLLIIDDLGTETTNSFVSSQLFLILNERNLRKKSTIISTNLSLENLSRQYSERTFSRISGYYQLYKFDVEDIRLKKKFNKVGHESSTC